MATNANEQIYGPIADKAAGKYGIDTALFRRLIMSESSFDPYAVNPQSVGGENASGIAQFLPSTAAERGVDPFDPYSALDGAASYLADLTKRYGLRGGLEAYKGATSAKGKAAMSGVIDNVIGDAETPSTDGNTQYDIMGNVTGATPAVGEGTVSPGLEREKSIWTYTLADWKAAFQSTAWGFLFGLIGIALVLFSIYMLTRQGGTNSIGAVKNVAGV